MENRPCCCWRRWQLESSTRTRSSPVSPTPRSFVIRPKSTALASTSPTTSGYTVRQQRLRGRDSGQIQHRQVVHRQNHAGLDRLRARHALASRSHRHTGTNDHMELGQHSQFLSVMDSSEMLARWFIADQTEMGRYRLKRYGIKPFWAGWPAGRAAWANRPTWVIPTLDLIYLRSTSIGTSLIRSDRWRGWPAVSHSRHIGDVDP